MMKKTRAKINRLCLYGGICLIVGAALVLTFWLWTVHSSQQKSADYIHTIRELMPEPQGAVPEERRDNTMAVFSIDGTNFAGIIEMPEHGSLLPVCGDWGELTKYPCRLSGSVYDRTIQIGGTSQKGQYDFYREISVGDALFFTDMEGNRFSYEVMDIQYERHADQTALRQENADLTLFIKNVHALEYILVFCDSLA